jgi:hypothetical protein
MVVSNQNIGAKLRRGFSLADAGRQAHLHAFLLPDEMGAGRLDAAMAQMLARGLYARVRSHQAAALLAEGVICSIGVRVEQIIA